MASHGDAGTQSGDKAVLSVNRVLYSRRSAPRIPVRGALLCSEVPRLLMAGDTRPMRAPHSSNINVSAPHGGVAGRCVHQDAAVIWGVFLIGQQRATSKHSGCLQTYHELCHHGASARHHSRCCVYGAYEQPVIGAPVHGPLPSNLSPRHMHSVCRRPHRLCASMYVSSTYT
jgi:hypothetical protein